MKPSLPNLPKSVRGLLAAFSLVSVAFAGEMSPAAKELVALDDAWSAAAVRKDVPAVVSYYAADACIYPPNDKLACGPEGAKAVWGGITDPNYSVSWKTTTAGVAQSGELGYTAGTYEEVIKNKDGTTTTNHGKYVCVWKKDASGHWKAIHDTWNPDTK